MTKAAGSLTAVCLGLARISWRVNKATYTSHLIYGANGLVWSGRGEEGVPSKSTGKWMCCLYCNPQAEIVAAVCSHPSEGGWAATLLLLRVSSSPPWPGTCFSQQVCSSSACPAHIGNGNFYITQHSSWPCRLFPSFSLDVAEAPTSLPWLWYNAMPVSARLIFPLKHEPSFTFHTVSLPQLRLCHSVYEFSPSEQTLGEWWPSVEALHRLCYRVLPVGVHIIQYKLTSVI